MRKKKRRRVRLARRAKYIKQQLRSSRIAGITVIKQTRARDDDYFWTGGGFSFIFSLRCVGFFFFFFLRVGPPTRRRNTPNGGPTSTRRTHHLLPPVSASFTFFFFFICVSVSIDLDLFFPVETLLAPLAKRGGIFR